MARLEHVGRAAEQLDRSEAAISRSISRLEAHYGTLFFAREGRGIRLTDHGRVFLAAVERALHELDAIEAVFTDGTHAECAEPIAVGFFATLGARIAPQIVRAFQEAVPSATFRLFQGPAPILQQRLLAGEIDLCLVSPRFDHRDLDWEPLWSEELFLYVPRGHWAANTVSGSIDLAAFKSEPFVALRPAFGLRRDFDRICAQAGFTPRLVCEGEEVATLQGLVGEGFGSALLPGSMQAYAKGAVRLSIMKPAARRTFGMARRRGDRLTSMSEAFVEFIRARAAAIQALAVHPENALDGGEHLKPPTNTLSPFRS